MVCSRLCVARTSGGTCGGVGRWSFCLNGSKHRKFGLWVLSSRYEARLLQDLSCSAPSERVSILGKKHEHVDATRMEV